MLARPTEGTPPSNRGLLNKRMRKEVERDAALSDRVVHSGDGVAIQFVHEVVEWDDSQTEIVRWAHLWNVADAVGERGPRQLVGVVSLTMGAKYPFRAPDVVARCCSPTLTLPQSSARRVGKKLVLPCVQTKFSLSN